MTMLKKMGPIGGLLGMLPGAGQMKEALANVDDRDIDRTAAIIQSMTPAERKDPKILNASRKKRVANGSGSTIAQVNALVERFGEARKMMSAMAGRFGLPGARNNNRKAVKGRKGKKGKASGRGPTPPKIKGGMPAGFPGMAGMGGMPGLGGAGVPQLPPGFGLDQLPAGFDPSTAEVPEEVDRQYMARPTPLHITGHDAATGERVEYWTAGGVFVDHPVRDAVEISGWTLPGFVDAHCHVGYSEAGAVTLEQAEQQARTNLAAGVLAIRDCGSPIDTRPLTDRDDLPILVRAGRHIARPKRYIRDLSVDLDDPADLPPRWPDRSPTAAAGSSSSGTGSTAASAISPRSGRTTCWPRPSRWRTTAGCRVTAHVFGEDALPGLLAAGIDCIEHGTGLTGETIDEMARQRCPPDPDDDQHRQLPDVRRRRHPVPGLRQAHAGSA